MSAYNTFALVQQFAEAMRCASPLSSSVDVPVSSRPKVWRNENCPTVEASESIDKLCDQVEERFDLGTECQETSECSSPAMTHDLTFEERCRKFDDLVYWVKDCQRRHAEKESFIGADGRLVGEMAMKPRYRLRNKIHSKFFAIAVESSGSESDVKTTDDKKTPAVKETRPVTKRTPDKLFPPKNFSPATQFTRTKKTIPVKKVSSVKRVTGEKDGGNNGYQDGVRVRDFAVYNYDTKKKSLPIHKSTSRKKMALVRWTDSKQGEVKVKDFAYANKTSNTQKPATTAMRSRRDVFSEAG
ncbi:hypothetical protein BC567DRAFT_252971 [Phyllosticta citribraziliensis]